MSRFLSLRPFSSLALFLSLSAACSIPAGTPRDACPDGPDCALVDAELGDGGVGGQGDGDAAGGGSSGGRLGQRPEEPGDGDGGNLGGGGAVGLLPASCADGEPCCEGESRTAISAIDQGRRAVGRLHRPDGMTCTATLIGIDTAITASSCVEDIDDPREIRFEPQVGFDAFDVPQRIELRVSRIVQGRDARDIVPYANWATLTITGMDYSAELGDDYRVMNRVPISQVPSEDLQALGYDEDLTSGGAPVERLCRILSLSADEGRSPETNCYTAEGGHGAPLYRFEDEQAEIVGVLGHPDNFERPECGAEPGSGSDRWKRNLASGIWFAGAPTDPRGLSVLRHPDGMLEVFAQDAAGPGRIVSREQLDGGQFGPWEERFSPLVVGEELEAAFREDGSPLLMSLGAQNDVARSYFQGARGWTSLSIYGFPGPAPYLVDDFSLANLGDGRAEYFEIVSDRLRRRARGSGDIFDGTLTPILRGDDYRAVSASEFLDEFLVVVATDDGAFAVRGTGESYSEPEDLDFLPNLRAVATVRVSETSMLIVATNDHGVLQIQTVDSDGSRSALESLLLRPSRVDRFLELDAAIDAFDVVHLFALGDDGNIYTLRGGAPANSFASSWERFYK